MSVLRGCVMIFGREFFFAVGSFCFCHHVLVPLFALEQRQKHERDERDADECNDTRTLYGTSTCRVYVLIYVHHYQITI